MKFASSRRREKVKPPAWKFHSRRRKKLQPPYSTSSLKIISPNCMSAYVPYGRKSESRKCIAKIVKIGTYHFNLHSVNLYYFNHLFLLLYNMHKCSKNIAELSILSGSSRLSRLGPLSRLSRLSRYGRLSRRKKLLSRRQSCSHRLTPLMYCYYPSDNTIYSRAVNFGSF